MASGVAVRVTARVPSIWVTVLGASFSLTVGDVADPDRLGPDVGDVLLLVGQIGLLLAQFLLRFGQVLLLVGQRFGLVGELVRLRPLISRLVGLLQRGVELLLQGLGLSLGLADAGSELDDLLLPGLESLDLGQLLQR